MEKKHQNNVIKATLLAIASMLTVMNASTAMAAELSPAETKTEIRVEVTQNAEEKLQFTAHMERAADLITDNAGMFRKAPSALNFDGTAEAGEFLEGSAQDDAAVSAIMNEAHLLEEERIRAAGIDLADAQGSADGYQNPAAIGIDGTAAEAGGFAEGSVEDMDAAAAIMSCVE